MAIAESVRRLSATLVSIVGTRLELASVELQEESLRLFSLLMVALGTLFCLFVSTLLAILLVLVLFWDTHRLPALLGMLAFFAVTTGALGLWVRNGYRQKPKLLGYTLAELAKDRESLRSSL